VRQTIMRGRGGESCLGCGNRHGSPRWCDPRYGKRTHL
jgi:hypothetical protein